MQRLRFLQLLGGLASAIMALACLIGLGGSALAATTPTDLASPGVTSSAQTLTNTTVNNAVTTVANQTSTVTQSQTPSTDQTVDSANQTSVNTTVDPSKTDASNPTVAPSSATTGSTVPSTNVTSTVTSPATTSTGGTVTGSSSLSGVVAAAVRAATAAPVAAYISVRDSGSILGLVAPVITAPVHAANPINKTPLKPMGLIGQLTALLTHFLAPLAGAGGAAALAVTRTAASSLVTLSSRVMLFVFAVTAANDYLAYLRRSGFAHAARSDADDFNSKTPLLMGYSRAGLTGLAGGPFLVGSYVWTNRTQTQRYRKGGR